MHKPSNLSFEEAANAPTIYCTVFAAFEDLTRELHPSDKVLSVTQPGRLHEVHGECNYSRAPVLSFLLILIEL